MIAATPYRWYWYFAAKTPIHGPDVGVMASTQLSLPLLHSIAALTPNPGPAVECNGCHPLSLAVVYCCHYTRPSLVLVLQIRSQDPLPLNVVPLLKAPEGHWKQQEVRLLRKSWKPTQANEVSRFEQTNCKGNGVNTFCLEPTDYKGHKD